MYVSLDLVTMVSIIISIPIYMSKLVLTCTIPTLYQLYGYLTMYSYKIWSSTRVYTRSVVCECVIGCG